MSFFRSISKVRHCHTSLAEKGEPFHSSPGLSGLPPGGERSIRLTFLVEEAADQPVCPVLPNTGPRPLRPLLSRI
jgi:hypothetical protein